MRYGTLIDVKATEIPLLGRDEVTYYDMPSLKPLWKDTYTYKECVDKKVVPVIDLFRHGHEDTFVAYTEQTEQLLGIPIRAIIKEKEDMLRLSRDMANTVRKKDQEIERQAEAIAYFHNMSLWQRLKFLFRGEV